jgi:hypothetical protein
MASIEPARARENPSSRVRYSTRNGSTIIPARLIRLVAKRSHTSRGNHRAHAMDSVANRPTKTATSSVAVSFRGLSAQLSGP